MTLSTQTILSHFSHVFKNEFNERKILHKSTHEDWGRSVSYNFVSGNYFSGSLWAVEKSNQLRNLSRTLLLTEDKYGNVELLAFWCNFATNEWGYSEIHKQSLWIPYLNQGRAYA